MASPKRPLLWALAGLAALGATLGVGAVLLWPGVPEGPDADELARGARLYGAHCAACHGANLEGEPNWRQRRADGTLPAPPHDASGHTWHHADQQLFDITKFGTAALVGGDYKTNMLGFGEVLSDEEIWAVLAYIRSRWPEEIQRRQRAISARTQ